MIKRLSDVKDNIEKIVKNPVQRGKETGFKCLDELYTTKKGSFTCWLGSPAHGKSELIFEMLINQAYKYGEISLIYSPETGTVEEIMIELAHKYLKKQIVRHNPLNEVATELDMHMALEWVDHHFVIIDGDENAYSFTQICEEGERFEKENNVTISNIMAEPYNELVHDMKDFGGRQDLYIEWFMTEIRRYCKKKGKHVHMSFHTGSQTAQKVGGITFYAMPKAREAAGGQAAFRKAMTWINIWRPANGLKNAQGNLYQPNEVLINIEKAKPKYISYRGTCSLFFDTVKNRFYEKINGMDCYGFDHIEKHDLILNAGIQQQQIRMFSEPQQLDIEDLPF